MNKLINSMLLETDEKVILKRSSLWNMVASVLNSVLSSILLFVITRVSNVNTAGMFSIASAIAYQCLSLGNFGSRNFQVSDVNKEYSFSDYFFIKVLSGTLMYGMLLYYAFGSGYTLEKALVVLTFGLFKSVDAIEDVYHGEYHRNNRLDIAAVLLTFRYFIAILTFVVVFCITHNLIITSIISTITTVMIAIIENKDLIKYFVHEKIHFHYQKLKNLLFILIPICISNYVKMYACNLPKYAIDATLTSELQTYFNVLIMPIFIINLLSDVIFRPFITQLSIDWFKKNKKHFTTLLLRQLGVIIGLTLCCMVGGYIIGMRLLEIVYNVEIYQYMNCLMILLIAGGFNTGTSFLTMVLTIQRQQKIFVVVYIIVCFLGVIIANPLVKAGGILGASILYFLICGSFFFIFLLLVILKLRRIDEE